MSNLRCCRPKTYVAHFVYRLQAEVYELRNTIQILKEKQRCSELALCRLQKTRTRLESEIAMKGETIRIDSKSCLVLRSAIVMDARSGPVYDMSANAESGSCIPACGPRVRPMIGGGCVPNAITYTGSACCAHA